MPVVYHTEPAPTAWKRFLCHLLALLPVRREL